jgi:DNA-binding transcriptional LysR family regulator
MELRHLRYFIGVADELNFTRAAQKLRVAQPALSRQVRQLEDELGVKLLERNAREVRLTRAGQAFYTEASALLKQSAQAIRAAQQRGASGPAELNLGYILGLFHSIVPRVLLAFRKEFPDSAVHLFDLTPPEQIDALARGHLDAGFIGFADEADAAGLHKKKVGSCNFVAVLPEDHRAAKQKRIRLASLADDFFLGISDRTYPAASKYVTNACQRAGFRPRFLQMVERGHTILGLVAGKCGVALVPESLKALPHPGIVFRPVTDPVAADLYIAWRAGQPAGVLENFLRLLGSLEYL